MSWQNFLELLERLNYGPDADLEVTVMRSEVLVLLRNNRGTPGAPSLLVVDELGLTGAAFQPIRYALHGFSAEVESLRLLLSTLDQAYFLLLREPIEYISERNFKMRGTPTEVLVATTLTSLPESGLVQQLVSKVFEPGHLMLLRSGRIIPAQEAARATAAITGGVGRVVSRLLLALQKGSQGDTVMDLVTRAPLSPSAGKEVGAVPLVCGFKIVQAVLITGVEVQAAAVAAAENGQAVTWGRAIKTGGFSASVSRGGYFGSISIPPLTLVQVLENYLTLLEGWVSEMRTGTRQENLIKLLAGDDSCLGAMSNTLLAIKAGGGADVALEHFHYLWEVAASRARACLASSTLSTRGRDFGRVSLRDLYADSLPAWDFRGPLSGMVFVNASRPRVNYNVPRGLTSIEDVLTTMPKEVLLYNVWFSPLMQKGFDSMVFFECMESGPGGPVVGDVACVVINNKHSSPLMSTALDLSIVSDDYKSLKQSLGAAWAEWSPRRTLVIVTNRDTMSGYITWESPTATQHTLVCRAPDLKRLYGEPLYNLFAAGPIVFGGVKMSASL